MTISNDVTAVLWDFDGTLVETRDKNMNVNRRIIEEVTGLPCSEFEVMASAEIYERAQRTSVNWREFYRVHFGLSEEETDQAGARWTPYQREDTTPTPLFEGIADALAGFDGLPQGLVSQNCSANIAATLSSYGLRDRFRCIIGYQEVPREGQKPAPDGMLDAIERLTAFDPGSVIYIGDHETDLRCAENTNRALAERGLPVRVVSVAALYGMDGLDEEWTARADYRAASPADITEIVANLNS